MSKLDISGYINQNSYNIFLECVNCNTIEEEECGHSRIRLQAWEDLSLCAACFWSKAFRPWIYLFVEQEAPPHNFFLDHFAVRLTDSQEDKKKPQTHCCSLKAVSEHLDTGSGIDGHRGVSLQEVDFRVDALHYNLLPDALKRNPHEDKWAIWHLRNKETIKVNYKLNAASAPMFISSSRSLTNLCCYMTHWRIWREH